MTNKVLNDELHAKMLMEQEAYEGWLLEQPAPVILENAYEYTIREDILTALDKGELEEAQAHALMESSTPLEDLFREWEKRVTTHPIEIWDCITEKANELAARQKPSIPIYTHSAAYASDHGESRTYHASLKANMNCCDAIEAAIADYYRDNQLDPKGAKVVIERFGFERTFFVLANSVQQKNWDGRISPDNKRWAKDIFMSEGGDLLDNDTSLQFAVNSHPGLLDLFITQARHEMLLTLPLTPDDIRQEAQRLLNDLQAYLDPSSPSRTHVMSELSKDFIIRATSRDMDRLTDYLPFNGAVISSLKGREGVFLFPPVGADFTLPLREPRVSIREKLQNTMPTATPVRSPTKKKEQEL